jgi:hypothetical protein
MYSFWQVVCPLLILRGMAMQRRAFIALFAGAVVARPLVALAQQTERMRRIGVLMLYPENDPQGQLRATAFRRELEKIGWKIGGNLQIDITGAEATPIGYDQPP